MHVPKPCKRLLKQYMVTVICWQALTFSYVLNRDQFMQPGNRLCTGARAPAMSKGDPQEHFLIFDREPPKLSLR